MKKYLPFILMLGLLISYTSGNDKELQKQNSYDQDIKNHPLYPLLMQDGILEQGKNNSDLFKSLLENWTEQGYLQDMLNSISSVPPVEVTGVLNQSTSFSDGVRLCGGKSLPGV